MMSALDHRLEMHNVLVKSSSWQLRSHAYCICTHWSCDLPGANNLVGCIDFCNTPVWICLIVSDTSSPPGRLISKPLMRTTVFVGFTLFVCSVITMTSAAYFWLSASICWHQLYHVDLRFVQRHLGPWISSSHLICYGVMFGCCCLTMGLMTMLLWLLGGLCARFWIACTMTVSSWVHSICFGTHSWQLQCTTMTGSTRVLTVWSMDNRLHLRFVARITGLGGERYQYVSRDMHSFVFMVVY